MMYSIRSRLPQNFSFSLDLVFCKTKLSHRILVFCWTWSSAKSSYSTKLWYSTRLVFYKIKLFCKVQIFCIFCIPQSPVSLIMVCFSSNTFSYFECPIYYPKDCESNSCNCSCSIANQLISFVCVGPGPEG